MNSLFGIPMDTVMGWLLSLFIIATVIVLVLALTNRLFFRMGLRNIPRRKAQTILIVIGLMLGTLIITSAFGTGDTVSYSIRSTALNGLGNVDETVTRATGQGASVVGATTYIDPAAQRPILATATRDRDVDGAMPVIVQPTPLQDLTSGQTKNKGVLTGIPTNYPAAFGALTTVDGQPASLTALGPNDLYIDQRGADVLNAKAGDHLRLFVGNRPVDFTVRAVLKNENLASGGLLSFSSGTVDPTVLVPLSRVQSLIGMPGAATDIYISNRGDAESGSSLSDTVTQRMRALLANTQQVAKAQAILSSAQGKAQLAKLITDPANSGVKSKLQDLQKQIALPGQSALLKSLLSDPKVISALQGITKAPAVSRPLNDALAAISDYRVQEVKKDGMDFADLIGSIFTTIFVVFGLFSIFAGILLIFLIFVMLAAERRAEMGMARAVGTKRRHLIMQFLFEGYLYDLGAALVGMILGILVGLGMVKVMAALFGAADFTLVSHIEPRSLVVAFCLGGLVTFLTVTISAWRVSRLNVVAAIRDLPENFGIKSSIGDAFRRPLRDLAVAGRRLRRGGPGGALWFIARLLLALVLAIPLGVLVGIAGAVLGALYSGGNVLALLTGIPVDVIAAFILAGKLLGRQLRGRPQALERVGFTLSGMGGLLLALWHAIIGWFVFFSRGPLFVFLGALLIALAAGVKSEFLFTLGISFVLIGAALLLRWLMAGLHVREEVRNRVGFSLAGILLVIFWLLPFDTLKNAGLPDYGGGVEMFFVSGVMLVIGGVWTVMYNSDLILGALLAVFGGIGHLAPIIKTAVTYPMQQKFRTGLSLGMFSLVIFSLMVMSVLNRSTSTNLDLDRDIGGYQIFGAVNPQNPIQNAQQVINNTPGLKGVSAVAGIAQVGIGVRQPGQDNQSWQSYFLNVADDAYLRTTRFILHSRANGYTSDAAVWQTLLTRPGYAVVDASLVPYKNGGGRFGGGFTLSGFHYEDASFKAPVIEVRDPGSGATGRLTVIGVLDQNAQNITNLTGGIYTGEKTLTSAGVPPLLPNIYFFRVAPGVDVHATALALGKAFLSNGLDVKEAKKEYDTNQAIGNGLNYLLEGFMALGLVVGIAALGVIAFRSVVERRQQIGMMRAIGFQRSMIRTSFLLESSFVAILGTLLGVALGLVLARNLVASFAKTDSTITLQVPWLQIVVIVLLAYIASLLTTYVPAWQASRVYPADALRYE